MRSFLATLREGGPPFTVEIFPRVHNQPVEDREAGFSDIARLCIERAGPAFAAFPLSDGT